ncbi:MAG TPA: lipopolysaccharide biosynthesis protein [Rhizobacter sp.]|nr:lipopolysaccharide biosynthesis protein [Rhizobacter sp.]
MADRKPKAIRSLIWTGLESIGLSGVSFVTLVVLSRYVTPSEFGVASLALAVIQILGIPLELGFHDALVQKPDVEDRHFNTAFTSTVSLGLVLCLLCWVFAGAFSRMVGDPMAGTVLQWMSLSLPATGFGSAVVAYQRREFQFRSLAIRSLSARLGAAAIAITMAVLGAGVWSLVAQQVLMVSMSTATLWALSSFRPRIDFSRSHFIVLAKFGARSTASMLLVFSIQRIFMLFVGSRFGSASAGLLNLAFRAVDMLRDLMAGAVSQLALPLFSRHQADRAVLFEKYGLAVILTCGLTLPIFALFAACTPEIVAVVFGPQWAAVTPYMIAMALLTFQSFPRMFASPLMTSLGYPQYPIPSQILQLILLVAGMLTLGSISPLGALAVWVLRVLIVTPIDMYRLKRTVGLSYRGQIPGYLRTASMAAVSALSAKGVGLALPAEVPGVLRLIAMLAIGGAMYLGLTLAFNRVFLSRLIEMARSFKEKTS